MTDLILKLFSSDWWELYLTITSLDFLFCLCLIWRYNRLHKNWIFYAYNALCWNNGRTPFHVKNNIRNSSYCLILVKKKETNAIAKVYKCKIYNSYWFNRAEGRNKDFSDGASTQKRGRRIYYSAEYSSKLHENEENEAIGSEKSLIIRVKGGN